MLAHLFTVATCLLLSVAAKCQVLTVVDEETLCPIDKVIISSPGKGSVVTNDKGQVDVTDFSGSDSIEIFKLGYNTEFSSYKFLSDNNYKISLKPLGVPFAEVIVSASGWGQKRKDIPGKITSISRSSILFFHPATSADLAGITGEVNIQKSQLGGGSPMIRGFAANRVLISVDGVRMNNAIFRSGNLHNIISIDPLSVSKTEIIFGPSSARYGSDAIGGSMNFITLNPAFTDDKPVISGNAITRFASAALEKTNHVDFNIGFKKLAMLSSITVTDFEDLMTGYYGPKEYLRPEYVLTFNGQDSVVNNNNPRIQRQTGYSQLNLLQKIRYKKSENVDFAYGFYYSNTTDIPRYDRLIEYKNGRPRDAEWYYGPQKWIMNSFQANLRAENKFYNDLKIIFAHQYFQESRHNRSFNSDHFFHRKENVNAYSVNIDFRKRLKDRQVLLYGMEMLHNKVSSGAVRENIRTGEQLNVQTRYPDNSRNSSSAIFLGYSNTYFSKLIVNAGLRLTYVNVNAVFDTAFYKIPATDFRLSAMAPSANIGSVYHISDNTRCNVNLSTGFRAPNIDDAAKVFDSEPGAIMVPNPDLKPEYAYNSEAGISKLIGGIIDIELGGFYTLLDNAMVRREFHLNGQDSIMYDGRNSRVFAVQNASRANVYGIQSEVEVFFTKKLTFVSRFTWQNGEEVLDDGSKASLRHAVPWFGISRLVYRSNKLRAEFYSVYQSEITYEQMSPVERAKPHLYAKDADGRPYAPFWMTFNLKFSYQPIRHLDFSAGIENLTDLRYRPYSSGISAPGRNFIFSVRSSF